MHLFRCSQEISASRALSLAVTALLGAVLAVGCASPGPPRAPSLELPQPVSDLAAERTGNTVELRFTVPHLSTDKLPLFDHKHPHTMLRGVICRAIGHRDCMPVAGISAELTAADHIEFAWHEVLPVELTLGPAMLLTYRVEFFSPAGRSAGKSDAAYTATGPAPAPVTALHAAGSRGGIILSWQRTPDTTADILLQRTALAPHPVNGRPLPREAIWLNANAHQNRTLDDTVSAGRPYRYTAVRRVLVTLGTRSLDIRSDISAPVDFTLKPIYPPPTPTDLTAAGFQPPAASGQSATFAVDLVWQPVSEAGVTAELAAPLAGYNIYRETLDASDHVIAARTRLNAASVPQPSFQDVTAQPGARYRYSVSSIDASGNESHAATALLEPSSQ